MEIELRHICKRYGKQMVIPDMSLVIEDQSFAVLLGPSGCGKTTLLRMIAGLETPDGGEILFDGEPVFSAEKHISVPPEERDLGFVFQDFALWPHMSVWDNVAFGLRMKGRSKDIGEKVPEALAAVHMTEFQDRRPGDLSGGQQQRVSLARAIAATSKCILFDEPLSALDAVLRMEMRDELKRLTAAFHVTSVFVTHDQSEAMCLADQIAVMERGLLQQYGTPHEIYSRPATAFTASFVGRSNWIGREALFRPEVAHEDARPGDRSFDTVVSAQRYMGGYYESDLVYGDQTWMVRSESPKDIGNHYTVYVAPEDIVDMRGRSRV